MSLAKVSLNKVAEKMEGTTGAEIKAVCTEAGYIAIRNKRTKIKQDDFESAIKKVKAEEDLEHLQMFG